VVINMAGLVEFDPPLSESLVPNVYGVRNVLSLVGALRAKLVHISTCYVVGKRDGRIPEDVPIVGYYPKREGADDTRFDVDDEIKWCERFIEDTTAAAGNAKRRLRERLSA